MLCFGRAVEEKSARVFQPLKVASDSHDALPGNAIRQLNKWHEIVNSAEYIAELSRTAHDSWSVCLGAFQVSTIIFLTKLLEKRKEYVTITRAELKACRKQVMLSLS
jgi:hypothetical protein